ncbi:hypothetical protein VP01_1439g2 [Puccinia sorghi]|uniref:Uncharacterized protein n=1 Tax=Puccinia sorghi TaxID=27349 RepID=A0A0L6VKT7_9BASI|nr:hypothetical protein VP01_1439g2 [Puccinia sorghi]
MELDSGVPGIVPLCKEMGGDEPTGAFFLANYYQTIKDLKKKEAAISRENASVMI